MSNMRATARELPSGTRGNQRTASAMGSLPIGGLGAKFKQPAMLVEA